ncbi:MAG: GntR family transcriptional regulator [Erysipelotrichaceae bacterium]
MFQLNPNSNQPIYEQIIDQVIQLIAKDVYQENEMLPSVRSLAMSLSINPNTVQKAYQELERSGYIYSIAKKGYFVSQPEHAKQQLEATLLDNLQQALLACRQFHISETSIQTVCKSTQEDKQ